jgi:hypothetical protein
VRQQRGSSAARNAEWRISSFRRCHVHASRREVSLTASSAELGCRESRDIQGMQKRTPPEEGVRFIL